MEIVLVMFALQCKHLIVDWCWQPAYEYKNKGTYLHPGGLRHAFKNALGMTRDAILGVLVLLQIKHLLVDWMWRSPYARDLRHSDSQISINW